MIKKLISIIISLSFIISISTLVYSASDNRIVIDILQKKLTLYEDDLVLKEYPVAVGKNYSQTPIGKFKIQNKIINPYYSKKNIPGGSIYNPLGTRWIGFKPHYGIHGNSNPQSISTFASAGCIRMYERDVQELYRNINIGTPVEIIYNPLNIIRDVNGNNPILLVYPDYYNKENNIQNKINNYLNTQNINKIKLEKLYNNLNKSTVIFSKEKVFLINGEYISQNILYKEDKYYIKLSDFEKYINIKFYLTEDRKLVYDSMNFEYIIKDSIIFLSLDSLTDNLGGKIIIDSFVDSIEYNLDYIKLNDVPIFTKYKDLTTTPKIYSEDLLKAIDIKNKTINNINYLFYKGVKVKEDDIITSERYINIDQLYNNFNIKYDISTYDNTINIWCDPEIFVGNRIIKGKIINDNIYISIDSLENLQYTNDYINLDNIKIIKIENMQHTNINNIKNYYDIDYNKYKTKIYINKVRLNSDGIKTPSEY